MLSNRVRGILLTPSGGVLLIKRLREGVEPYWVAPGGGIEKTDASPEAALRRELAEELGATVEIQRFAFKVESQSYPDQVIQQAFYLCRLIEYNLARRSGPEFDHPEHGQYLPDEVPLVRAVLSRMNIRPSMLKAYLEEISR